MDGFARELAPALAYAAGLKSAGVFPVAGSSPASRTIPSIFFSDRNHSFGYFSELRQLG
jgi:hypothetical protein